MAPNNADKLNKVTGLLRIICVSFGWKMHWRTIIVPFIKGNQEKILALYDEIEKVMREE